MVDSARRGFLTGAFLTSEGREEIDRQGRPAGIEPPWIAGHCSRERCIDCEGPCVAACEPGIVKRHPEGHAFDGVPWLDFSAGACTWCGACAEACPIEEVAVSADSRPDLGLAQLNKGSCLAWQSVVCVSCRFACPEKAIAADAMSRPSIVASRCTGCGACVAVCPRHAIDITALPDIP